MADKAQKKKSNFSIIVSSIYEGLL